MICPNCHEPMELEQTETILMHTVMEEFPFEYDEEVEQNWWHCMICDYTDTTYDA